jgi:DNA invertase Pin-like site-specific DNA recombinase
MRAAIYARVSTSDQEPENQLAELRRYIAARGWTSVEYVDRGVSGAKDRRPALDQLVRDAKRRRFDVLVCWRLDRLGRNLKHLITLIDDLQSLGVAFVSLAEGIDATTPAGKLQLHILAAIAEFERERIRERVLAGLQRAKANGRRLGRPRREVPATVRQMVDSGETIRAAAKRLGVSRSTAQRWLAASQKTLSPVD